MSALTAYQDVNVMKNRLLFCLIAVFSLIVPMNTQVVCAEEHNGRPTVALALGGGGARGVAHVGVLRVLEREGIPVDYVVGSSTGAFVGALYCAGVPLSQIEKVILDGSAKNAFAPRPIIARALLRSWWLLPSAKYRAGYPGIYNGKNFARFINRMVPEDQRRIENLKIPFTCVVTNLVDGKPHQLTSGDLGETVQAACTIPGVHRPVLTNGQLFVDGGLSANMPTFPARATGADIVIAVDVDDDVNVIDPKSMKSLRNMANRVTSIVVCALDVAPRRAADVVVRPEVGGIALLSRNRDHLTKAIAEGERAAIESMPAIRARMNRASIVQKSPPVRVSASGEPAAN
jgi:NTE family protein